MGGMAEVGRGAPVWDTVRPGEDARGSNRSISGKRARRWKCKTGTSVQRGAAEILRRESMVGRVCRGAVNEIIGNPKRALSDKIGK